MSLLCLFLRRLRRRGGRARLCKSLHRSLFGPVVHYVPAPRAVPRHAAPTGRLTKGGDAPLALFTPPPHGWVEGALEPSARERAVKRHVRKCNEKCVAHHRSMEFLTDAFLRFLS